MAQNNRVEVEIVATDEATPKIAKLEKRIDGLEADEARIIITADIKKLDSQLTDALAKMAKLDGDELTVQARLVGTLEDDLIAAAHLFDQLDGQTGTVKLTADTSDLDAGVTKAKSGVDEIGKSADSSKSALANMVGNSAQDLGQLGGVAGSAGVAIGQLAEYASDASLAGEGLGSVLGSMAGVAVPIAALSIGLGVLNSHMQEGKQRAKDIADATEEYATALTHAADAGEGIGDVFATVAASKADKFFTGLGDDAKPTIDALDTLGIKYSDVVLAFQKGTGPVADAMRDYKSLSTEIDRIKFNEFVDTGDALILYAQRTGQTTESVKRRYEAGKKLNEQLGDEAELSAIGASNASAVSRYRDGAALATERQAAALARLNIENDKDGTIAREKLPNLAAEEAARRRAADASDNQRDALARLNTQEERNEQARAASRKRGQAAVTEATLALQGLAASVDEIESGALAKALDIGNGPLDSLTSIQNINQEIRDFADFINDPEGLAGKIPNIFDPADVNADDFLAKIAGLKAPIQAQIEQTFGESGAAAAEAMADSLVETISKQTGLTPDVVSTLLGLDDLEAKIKISIEETSKAKAQRQLELLTGLTGATPWIATIQLALDAGTITGDQAQILVQEALRGQGVKIPSELEVPSTDQAFLAAQAAANANPVTIPVRLGVSADQMERLIAQGISVPGGNFGTPTQTPVTINHTTINPAGTPPETVGSVRVYYNRNGDRTET